MKKHAKLWSAAAVGLFALMAAPPSAEAHERWALGAAFRIGDVHFRVGFADAGPRRGHFYFVSPRPIRFGGYACNGYCYRSAGRYYHHPSCPLVQHHFHRYGYDPYWAIDYYAPPRRRHLYYDDGYGRHHPRKWYRRVPPGHRKHRHHKHHKDCAWHGYPY